MQSIKLYLRGKYIKQGSTEALSIDIRERVEFANIKSQKIHSYTATKLMLEFIPWIKQFDIEWQPLIKAKLKIKDTTKHQKHIYMAL